MFRELAGDALVALRAPDKQGWEPDLAFSRSYSGRS
jgi:hypothetical protein